MQTTFKDIGKTEPNAAAKKQSSLAERAKYQFEADSEDDEMENGAPKSFACSKIWR